MNVTHYYRDHNHTTQRDLRPASAQFYGAVVGTVDTGTEKAVTGYNGNHLQFYIAAGPSLRYRVDVNTLSRNGAAILTYVADETLSPNSSGPPFGFPSYGVFTAPEVKLSYKETGISDDQFAPVSYMRIESQLEAALGQADFVVAYGQIFDDGGANGKGIHDTHRNPSKPEQDGAIVVYLTMQPNQSLIRRWFFFMFNDESVG